MLRLRQKMESAVGQPEGVSHGTASWNPPLAKQNMHRIKKKFSFPGRDYAVAVILVLAAFFLRWLLDPVLSEHLPFWTFWIAIGVAVWRYGIGPTLLVTALGLIVGDYFFVEPRNSLAFIGSFHFVVLGAYVSVAAVICSLGAVMRVAQQRSEVQYNETLRQKKFLEREVQERQKGEALLHAVLETLPVGVWILNAQGKIIKGNAASQTIWGGARYVGMEEFEEYKGWWLDTGKRIEPHEWAAARAIARGETSLNEEVEIETFDGTRKIILNAAMPLRDGWDAITGAIIVNQDITERKRVEAAAKTQNRRIELMHEAAAFLLSSEGPVENISEIYQHIAEFFRADAFFEYAVDEKGEGLILQVCGGISAEAKPNFGHLNFGETICHCIPGQRKAVMATDIQHSDDPTVQAVKTLGIRAYSCHPMMVGDQLIGTLAFASRQRDAFDREDQDFFATLARYVAIARERARLTTELRRHTENLQELVAERTEELERFSYSIMHDMRAPLRAMQGFGQMLREEYGDKLDDAGADFLRRIAEAAQRMDHLITDALNYSKIMRKEFELEPVDAGALLRGIVESYPQFQPPHAEIEIAKNFPTVMGNSAGLTQCFSNLIENAIKFAKPGQMARLRISAEKRGEFVRLWFEDNGIGVAREHQRRIFVMFQQLDKETEGTGIGLALVQKAVERMKGKVGIESKVGEGSRFWVELANAEPQQEPAASRMSVEKSLGLKS
jgi:PAS domain S-box-containing protein